MRQAALGMQPKLKVVFVGLFFILILTSVSSAAWETNYQGSVSCSTSGVVDESWLLSCFQAQSQEISRHSESFTGITRSHPAKGKFYRVLRVIDGDSLEIEAVGEVRLIGVDTPELYHPLKPVQYYAKEASEYVRNLLSQSRVRLEYDQEKIDKYGRTLAYVYLEDGRCLNEEIIRHGHGFALLRFPFKYLIKYKEIEAQARANGLGLWANQGLNEFNWIVTQEMLPYEIFEMANNWWAVRYKEFVKLRLTAEELREELVCLRQWTNEFSLSDLEKTLLSNGWLKVKK
jgi:micrococcal nuclease